MLLHLLQPKHQKTSLKVRVGRGGKRGNTSGRGQKGQKSRSGHRIRPAERDLIIRLPKLRGYNNKPLTIPAVTLNLRDLSHLKETTVTIEALRVARLIGGRDMVVKLLGPGEATRAYVVSGIRVSKSAQQAITKAGGTVK